MGNLSDKRMRDNILEIFFYPEENVKEAVKRLDEYFNQGFSEKMNRFMLYPTEWEELKNKIFGKELTK